MGTQVNELLSPALERMIARVPCPYRVPERVTPSDVTKLTCSVTSTGVAVGDGVGVAALLVGAAPCEVPQPERSVKRTSRNK